MSKAKKEESETEKECAKSIGVALVHSAKFQERRDFEEIVQRIRSGHPEIDAFIVDNFRPTQEDYDRVAARPTLVFSPIFLKEFQPEAAKIYHGQPISKIDQQRILQLNGVSTPRLERIALKFYDPADWGEWVVIKPLSFRDQSSGDLFRLRLVDLNRDIAFKEDYLRKLVTQPYAIQAWVNTGPRLTYMRALTLFGEVLYASRHELAEDFTPEDEAGAISKFIRVTARGRRRKNKESVLPDEVADLCRRTYRAFPERALLGIDVIYDVDAEKYYVLEINAGGNTWHFSSRHIKKMFNNQQKFRKSRKKKIKQFNAFQRAADVIAEKAKEDLSSLGQTD